MKKYKGIIFDLDGTLLDTLFDLRDSVNYVLQQAGYEVRSIEEIRSFVGNGLGSLMERALPRGKANPTYDQLLRQLSVYYATHCNDKTKPYEGIKEVLAVLKQKGYAIAIVSNKPFDEVVKLNQFYFGDLITTAIGARQGIRKKPAPDTVFLALEELGCNNQEVVFVGDSEVDVATALAAEVDCIGVTWGFRSREVLEKSGATVLVETPLGLLDLIV